MEEIWKDIPGYEGFYQASTLGRIRSVDHYAMHSTGNGKVFRKGKILRLQNEGNRYLSVYLSKFGKYATCLVHRLVATTFIPNPDNLPVINHIDLNTHNNAVSNLEWVTQQDNCLHAIANGHSPKISPEGRLRITEGAKRAMGKKIICLNTNEIFDTITDASIATHIPRTTIIRSAKTNCIVKKKYQFRYITDNEPSNASGSIRIAPECLIR